MKEKLITYFNEYMYIINAPMRVLFFASREAQFIASLIWGLIVVPFLLLVGCLFLFI